MTISSVGSSTTTTATNSTTDPTAQIFGNVPGGRLGKHEFLKLLTTQLRYQDPLDPMEGAEMATQLAQFTSVEQLVNIGDQLKTSSSQSDAVLAALNNSVAMNAIGRTVTAPGNVLNLPAEATVTALIGGAGTGTLQVLDGSGKVVGSRSLGTLNAGLATMDLGDAAKGLPAGTYTYKVLVTDSKSVPVETTTFSRIKIDGVTYGTDGAMLTSGGMRIPITSVIKIES
jgi:flagellar basal-body rod modification protein FlgD